MKMTGLRTGSLALLFSFSGLCHSATTLATGVIQFHGRIVEAPCTPSSQLHTFKLINCPPAARGNDVRVQSTASAAAVGASSAKNVRLKLVTDTRNNERYYQQHYSVIDTSGKAVTSGSYIITLTNR